MRSRTSIISIMKITLGTDILCLSNQLGEKEPSLEPEDGQVSPPCSAPEFQTVNHTDSSVSFVSSHDIQAAGPKDNPKHSLSTSCCDNRSAYSSLVSLLLDFHLFLLYFFNRYVNSTIF